MAETYTREQIVRKLKRLKSRYEKGIVEAKSLGQIESYKAYVCMIASLDEAIIAFQKGKNER